MCLRRVLILSLWRHREPLTDSALVFTTLQRVFQILVLNMALCVSNGARRRLSPSKRKSLVVDICVFDQPERRGEWVCVACWFPKQQHSTLSLIVTSLQLFSCLLIMRGVWKIN